MKKAKIAPKLFGYWVVMFIASLLMLGISLLLTMVLMKYQIIFLYVSFAWMLSIVCVLPIILLIWLVCGWSEGEDNK